MLNWLKGLSRPPVMGSNGHQWVARDSVERNRNTALEELQGLFLPVVSTAPPILPCSLVGSENNQYTYLDPLVFDRPMDGDRNDTGGRF